jgi:hypothetical protein
VLCWLRKVPIINGSTSRSLKMRHRSNKRMPAHVRVAAFTQNLPSPGRFGDSEPNLSTDLNEASFVSCGAEGHYFGNRLWLFVLQGSRSTTKLKLCRHSCGAPPMCHTRKLDLVL